ncbi:DUF2017 family protein [Tessaracoccus antarcticus]|uniref:DUF2017 family protein n=1 Tax=Tessaracoccus antarcticus TaxID=2479848 RepID=A0A3M0GBV0_9ACTN|nr:DUF2017 family protein [Tessaracoccus antarcticus]RMB62300.1 DUF2017 family protein [Tessaracoccus antarcticus]
MSDDDIVWEFDGGDGRTDVLMALVVQQLNALDSLLPEGEDEDDPMARLAAELSERPVELLDSNPALARLFPPALADAKEAEQFRRDAIGQQARARRTAGRTVLADCAVDDGVDDGMVAVRKDHVDAWVTTLAGLRAAWNVELTGSAERQVSVSRSNIRANPTAATICDWLGAVLEDALQAHMFQS